MTPTPNPETIRKFAFEGPFSIAQLVVAGSLVALLIGFFAWRDYRRSGSLKLLAFLLVPRLVALLVVLWMLAGPSVVTLERKLKSKSILLMVDRSASMGLVDAVDGSGNTVRWSAAQANGQAIPAIGALDRVIGTLTSAQMDLARLRRLSQTADSAQPSQALWEQLHRTVASAAKELGTVTLDPARAGPESPAELGRIAAFLNEGFASEPAQLETVPGSPGRTRHPPQSDRLDEADAFITGGLRRVEHLAEKLAARYEQAPSPQETAGLAAQSELARKDKVTAWLEFAENSWLKALNTRAAVLRYAFADHVQPVAGRDWREAFTDWTNQAVAGTDLGAALNRAALDAGQQSVEAVVLVTDGGHNAPGDPREIATGLRGVPLLVVPIGSLEIPRDVILHHIQCPRAAFKNDAVVVEAMVTAYDCQDETLRVELLSDDAVVNRQTLTASSKIFDGRVSFRWQTAALGRHVLKVRVAPLPREHSLANNEAQAEVEVMEDTIRVLLADAFPRWEFRYLVNLFKRDPHVDFEQLLFEPNTDSPGAGTRPSFPTDLAGWRRYRVVILGDVNPGQLPLAQQELLRKYVVEDGGNLVVIAGETAMPTAFANQPLEGMLPASSAPLAPRSGFGLVVTPEGSVSVATQLEQDPLASDRVWREMSTKLPIYGLSPVSQPKATGHVLIAATAPGQAAQPRAFLSWQYVGLGRVIYLAAPVSYQLRYQTGDYYHHRFWGQLLRWAIAREMSSGSKNVHLLTDKNRYETGEQAQIVLRLGQNDGTAVAGAPCHVQALAGNRLLKVVALHEEADLPGTYRGTLDNLPVGPITLRAGGSTVDSLLLSEAHPNPVECLVNVDPNGTTELSNPLCNLPLLNQIAEVSGGTVLPPASLQNALARVNMTPEVQETVLSRQANWARWDFLWIFIGCLTIEWLARRYWRML